MHFSIKSSLRFFFILFFVANTPVTAKTLEDPLPSWNAGQNKKNIIAFVEKVTTPGSKSYVEPQDRIATFDLDGTILLEKPGYAITDFLAPEIKKLGEKNPELLQQPHAQALLKRDWEYFAKHDINDPQGIYAIILKAYQGKSDNDYKQDAAHFMLTQDHQRFHVPYIKTTYKPMLELVTYLQKNHFQVYICSGSDIIFIRSVSQKMLNISPQNVIGTQVLTSLQQSDHQVNFVRENDYVQPINDKAGKAVNIHKFIGKSPIFAAGNSRGDMEMLDMTKLNHLPHLEILVIHDDPKREYQYAVENMSRLAKEHGWSQISMKNDFKEIFDFN